MKTFALVALLLAGVFPGVAEIAELKFRATGRAKGRPTDVALAQSPARPAIVKPFPTGLSGTLVFHSDLRGPDNPQGRGRIYTLDLATGSIAILTTGRDYRDENPRWSPDGERIAFKSNRDGAG